MVWRDSSIVLDCLNARFPTDSIMTSYIHDMFVFLFYYIGGFSI
jgi:hypothetical protein